MIHIFFMIWAKKVSSFLHNAVERIKEVSSPPIIKSNQLNPPVSACPTTSQTGTWDFIPARIRWSYRRNFPADQNPSLAELSASEMWGRVLSVPYLNPAGMQNRGGLCSLSSSSVAASLTKGRNCIQTEPCYDSASIQSKVYEKIDLCSFFGNATHC